MEKEIGVELLQERAKMIAGYIPKGYKEKSLTWEWNPDKNEQGRVPDVIEIEREEKEVYYFRDGIILFADGCFATYERIIDERNKQKIIVFYRKDRKKDRKKKKWIVI